MKKHLSVFICLIAMCFLSTNLLAWYPDSIPDLDVLDVDTSGVHEPTAYELANPTITSSNPLPGATEGWTGGGFWTGGSLVDPSYFAYWSPGESDDFFDVMWIFVYTQGATLTDPVVSMENNTLYDHSVELKYDDDTNYSGSSYWPTFGNASDWNLWVYYIEPRSATEIIYFTQQMHGYKMELYGKTVIPEPTTILLLLGSIFGLFIKKFKK
ncbi:PEP-CTERM sorting domain-containing protein [bacterium]|nr:PEP-CTERM sorting domain-containing protein [bacterium]